MKIQHLSIVSLFAFSIGLAASGCDTKVSQCNRLIDTVNKHTQALSDAIGKLGDVDQKPEVAQEFATVVKTADEEISALEFKDEQIAGFAKEYRDLLTEADKVGKTIGDAANAKDLEQLDTAMESANKVVKMEDDIVGKVNTYCQAP
jgi:RNA processing factor Prp31